MIMGWPNHQASCSHTARLNIGLVLTLFAACDAAPAKKELYKEVHRPTYHFTPARNWSNDPNGLVHFEGEYHLFFQHNPFGNKWGNLSWGHAVSRDLVNWKELPIAIAKGELMIFSGSAVVDWGNSAGFSTDGQPALIALYTGHHEKTYRQTQQLAFSTDKGRTWTPYSGNPIIDINSINGFRDPKVFWHKPTNRWVMAITLSNDRKIAFYTSPNLKEWKLVSTFGPSGSVIGVWECPNLFELDVVGRTGEKKWVIAVSVNNASIAGGSGTQYFVGDFDGERFAPTDDTRFGKAHWVDHGKDFYAAQSWADLPDTDGRTIWIAWFTNLAYSELVPTHPWRGSMTIPRSLSLKPAGENFELRQEPIRELERLRADEMQVVSIPLSSSKANLKLPAQTDSSLEMQAILRPGTAAEMGFLLSFGKDYQATIGYDARNGRLFLDRTNSGPVFSADFPGRHHMPVSLSGGTIDLHIFLDRSSIEIFANDGTRVISDLIFPGTVLSAMSVYATNGNAEVADLRIWRLREMTR